MDVLYFMKEEYCLVRESLTGLAGGDAQLLQDGALLDFLSRLALILRIEDELLIPELAERIRHGKPMIDVAVAQGKILSSHVATGIRQGRMADAKRLEILSILSGHLDHMEKVVLPRIRIEVSTQTREEIGVVAMDYRDDFLLPQARRGKSNGTRSISA